jgi:hypothetical protein
MADLQNWTLDLLRTDSAMMSWMEERRHDWTPLVQSVILKILEGYSIILVTDDTQKWLGDYIISNLNSKFKNRPILPIFKLKSLMPEYKTFIQEQNFEMIKDMLSLSLKDEYLFWYIGQANNQMASIAKHNPYSFLWIMDEEVENSFFLRSVDDLLDLKLLHLVRIFDKTVDAAIVGELEL